MWKTTNYTFCASVDHPKSQEGETVKIKILSYQIYIKNDSGEKNKTAG